MTTREYFRQLRREQWEVDAAFFARMFSIFPAGETVMLGVCSMPQAQGDPTLSTTRLTFSALEQCALYIRDVVRVGAFHDFHRDVCYGYTKIAPIVAPAQAQFPVMRPEIWRGPVFGPYWGDLGYVPRFGRLVD